MNKSIHNKNNEIHQFYNFFKKCPNKKQIHSIKYCPHCEKLLSRDFNACLNIRERLINRCASQSTESSNITDEINIV
jgi:hypothetical protein